MRITFNMPNKAHQAEANRVRAPVLFLLRERNLACKVAWPLYLAQLIRDVSSLKYLRNALPKFLLQISIIFN